MKRYRYIIVGGGMTADGAARGIREVDTTGEIAIFTAEAHAPYNRPPLSKALWKGKPLDSIWRHTETTGAEIHLQTRVTGLDPQARVLTDHAGNRYGYDKLLLATGGAVRRLPLADEGVIYFRTLDDYERLRAATGRNAEIAVIGGGFIGSEIAAALAQNGSRVSLVFPERGIGERIYPEGLSQFLNDHFRGKGVDVLPGETVSALERRDGRYTLHLTSGRTLGADVVVAGIGIQPSPELAQAAGIHVDNGIWVDEFLRTNQPGVYAAGDVANFVSAALNTRVRVEHEDNALTMGAVAGRNMAGRAEPYHHLPFFYSDLFEHGYEAVGELDSRLEIVEDWKERFRQGVIYYVRGGRVRGVLLWNTWGKLDAARALIAAGQDVPRESLAGRLSG